MARSSVYLAVAQFYDPPNQGLSRTSSLFFLEAAPSGGLASVRIAHKIDAVGAKDVYTWRMKWTFAKCTTVLGGLQDCKPAEEEAQFLAFACDQGTSPVLRWDAKGKKLVHVQVRLQASMQASMSSSSVFSVLHDTNYHHN